MLLFAPSASFTAHPFLHDTLPYKPSDLVPIVRVSNTVIGISVPADLPITSVNNLVEMALAKSGELNWAGVTGGLDFLVESWLKKSNIDMKKVPYRNPVDAANDLAANRVQFFQSAYAIARPQLQAGKIRLLAVTNTVRAPVAPDIPTIREAGHPDLEFDGLVGLFGPPFMPMALRDQIANDIMELIGNDSKIKEQLAITAQLLNLGGPAEFAMSVDRQRAQIAQAAKKLDTKSAR